MARVAGAPGMEPDGHPGVGPGGNGVGVRGWFRTVVSRDGAARELAADGADPGGVRVVDPGGPMNLDDPRALERVDRHDTRRVLTDFPAHCRQGHALQPIPAPTGGRPRLVVVAGMGGSAAGGDLVAACAAETLDVPILVHRG